MVVVVDNVTAENEEGSNEVVVKSAKGIERDTPQVGSGFLIYITR